MTSRLGGLRAFLLLKLVEIVSRLRLRKHVTTGIETLIHLLGLNLI